MSQTDLDPSCIFCKIVAGNHPCRKVYQDDLVTAFHDIHPVAPIHILIIPNKHIRSINSLEPVDEPVIGHLFSIAQLITSQEGIERDGYRLIINTGPNAGQAIFHLHLHLIGGRRMRFPMG